MAGELVLAAAYLAGVGIVVAALVNVIRIMKDRP